MTSKYGAFAAIFAGVCSIGLAWGAATLWPEGFLHTPFTEQSFAVQLDAIGSLVMASVAFPAALFALFELAERFSMKENR